MLKAEACWIGQVLSGVPPEHLSPMLNIGSADAEFREKIQPWIDHEIFAPLRQRGVTIRHLDIQEGEGIDLHGDLNDKKFFESLRLGGYRSLMCCNVLEHISNPANLCARLQDLVPLGGYLLVTVPYRFPYHPDPIDTLFRPELNELTTLFQRSRVVSSITLDCGTGWDYVDRNPRMLVKRVLHRVRGMREHGGAKGTTSFLPWLFRHFKQQGIMLYRTN